MAEDVQRAVPPQLKHCRLGQPDRPVNSGCHEERQYLSTVDGDDAALDEHQRHDADWVKTRRLTAPDALRANSLVFNQNSGLLRIPPGAMKKISSK
jgi:hypothetical protein